MADDQMGMRGEDGRGFVPWTKIFTAFKVALDPKKLLLAGAGILTMALGWYVLAIIFYLPRGMPTWSKYQTYYQNDEGRAWKLFKRDLNRWNLLHKLAGWNQEGKPVPYGVADFAHSPEEYRKVQETIESIKKDTSKWRQKVTTPDFSKKAQTYSFEVSNISISFEVDPAEKDKIRDAIPKDLTAQQLAAAYDPEKKELRFNNVPIKLSHPDSEWVEFQKDLDKSLSLQKIEDQINDPQDKGKYGGKNSPYTATALRILRLEEQRRYKPMGLLRTWPWFEERGPNPFLMVTGSTAAQVEGVRSMPWERGEFVTWFFNDQLPVLLEPLFKFLAPVFYLLHPSAGGLNQLYLLLVVFWTIATWSFFGGAITRMAAVQVARQNEKVGLRDAIKFTIDRYKAFFLAQAWPLVFLAFLTILLLIFGIIETNIPGVGDILVAGLGFPIAFLFGLFMALILVGLIGWPLMYATISTEGSDSFDALSRSYSYVYQAPWNYIWYVFIAVLYGAALTFFIGFMGSLSVYLTKWGMSLSPLIWGDREPSYLFYFAPTSYGWRDLLLYQSPEVNTVEVIRNSGVVDQSYRFNQSYVDQLMFHNYIGSFLVAIWVYLLFLLVIGFSYSYFWTASAIVYLLMRRRVDDTEMDEIHLEDEDTDVPYSPPSSPTESPEKEGSSLQMVDAPAIKSSPPSDDPPPSTSSTEGSDSSASPAGESPAEPANDTPPSEQSSTDGDLDEKGEGDREEEEKKEA